MTDEELDREVTRALLDKARSGGWENAAPYLRRHAAEHAADAGMLGELVTSGDYLSYAEPDILLPRLRGPLEGEAALLAAAYRDSARHHRSTDAPRQRAERLALDRARAGLPVPELPHTAWRPRWAVGADIHPALLDTLDGQGNFAQLVACTELGGRPVVVIAGEAALRVWDLATATPIGRPISLEGVGAPAAMDASAGGGHSVLLVVAEDRSIHAWNLNNGDRLPRPAFDLGPVDQVACTVLHDAPVVTAVSGDRLRTWAPDTGSAIIEVELDGADTLISAVDHATVHGREYAVAVTAVGDIVGWDMITGERTHLVSAGLEAGVLSFATSEVGGDAIAVASDFQGPVRAWNLRTGALLGEILPYLVTAAASVIGFYTAGGDTILVLQCPDQTVRTWNLSSDEQPHHILPGTNTGMWGGGIAALDGRPVLVTGDGDGVVRIWDPARLASARWDTPVETGGFAGGAQLPGTGDLVTGGFDGAFRVWLLGTPGGHVRQPVGGASVQVVGAVEIDGARLVVISSDDGLLRVWNPRSLRQVGRALPARHRPEPESSEAVTALACGVVDGRLLALTGTNIDGTVMVWDLLASARVGELPGADNPGVSIATIIEAHGRTLAVTADFQGFLHLWDLATRTRLTDPIPGPANGFCALVPAVLDGRPVVVAGGFSGTVTVVDPLTGTAIGEPLTVSPPGLSTLACATVDGRLIAYCAGYDGVVRIWDLDERVGLYEIGVPGTIQLLVPAPDGALVVGCGTELIVFDPPQVWSRP